MNLKFLKGDQCPVCGCSVVCSEWVELEMSGDKPKTHCNGERWEHRQFACGLELEYVPNFQTTTVKNTNRCKNNPEIIKRDGDRKAFLNLLINAAKKAKNVDDAYRQFITGELSGKIRNL